MAKKSYAQQLEENLEAARIRVRQGREAKNLRDNSKTLFEIIDGEISLAVNRMTSDKPLAYEEYLSAHGEVKGIRRIRQLLDTKETEAESVSEQVQVIEQQLESMK